MPINTFIYKRMSQRIDALVHAKLWAQVLVGLFLGVIVGLLLGPDFDLVDRRTAALLGAWLSLPGQLFLGLVGMVVIPLLATSIMLGLAGAGGGASLRSLGWRLAVYIVLTTVAAAALGSGLVTLLSPGALVPDLPSASIALPTPNHSIAGSKVMLEELPKELPRIIISLIPQDVGTAVIKRDFLPIVLFSVFLGIAFVTAEDKATLRPLHSSVAVISRAICRAPSWGY